ncbi:lysylphosphatidylglycerol synthase domain-containing protein [Methylobacterium crusticola]|uniref:lysylphosphatidylglycerol synthase domain-containing protein n=1 Tax=Methylobacterium crusticola TaxID=1697972 RepID=UPI001EE1AE87|nr:lysylphosphatidylglycerol synthase domain-containing protein [Methylobacterium crusticola]
MPETNEPGTKPAGPGRRRRWTLIVAVLSVVLGGYLLARTLGGYSLDQLVASVRALPAGRLAAAGAFAAASYLCLCGIDWLALRAAGRPLPFGRVALAAFISLSLGHSIGLAGLSSGAIRYRFYTRWGLGTGDVARVVLFCGVTVGLGLMALGAVAVLADPGLAREVTGLGRPAVLASGLACAGGVALYLGLAARLRAPLRIRRWSIALPPLPLAAAQVGLGALNFALVSACLHQALAAVSDVGFLGVVSVFVIANAAVLITHVPGGLGVIESVVVHLLPKTDVIGPLIAFRFLYFLVPLALGLAAFAVTEAVFRWRGAGARRGFAWRATSA